MRKHLEALPVDDGRARLVVLLLGDPHLLEGGEGGQDGSSDPDRVFPLWWSNGLDLHSAGSKSSDLLLHPVSDTGVHSGPSGQDNIGVQVLPDINIALHDGVVGCLVYTTVFHTDEGRLEEGLRSSEPLIANSDHLTVREFIGLLESAGACSGGHLLLKVKSNIAQLLLDVPDNLPLSGGGEGVAALSEDLHQVVGELTASKVKT